MKRTNSIGEVTLMTLSEVADYLRVTRKTIYRLLDRRGIPAIKVGRQWRFEKDSIDGWLRQNTIEMMTSILVIDDDEATCTFFKDTLEAEGLKVTPVTESSRGLELISEQDYDLVFLDLKMPGMDGAELFRRIRMARPNLPVIIVTGYPDSEMMAKALAYGPLGIIQKPFTSADILTAANNYLRFDTQTK
jgi:excisionase family DNA binding protein